MDRLFEKALLIGKALTIDERVSAMEKFSEDLPYCDAGIHQHNFRYDSFLDWQSSIDKALDCYSDLELTKEDLEDFVKETKKRIKDLEEELIEIREDIALVKLEMDSTKNKDHKSHKHKIYMGLIEEEKLIKEDIGDTEKEINYLTRALQEYKDDLPDDPILIEGSSEDIQ